jgi:hypothetical protein
VYRIIVIIAEVAIRRDCHYGVCFLGSGGERGDVIRREGWMREVWRGDEVFIGGVRESRKEWERKRTD